MEDATAFVKWEIVLQADGSEVRSAHDNFIADQRYIFHLQKGNHMLTVTSSVEEIKQLSRLIRGIKVAMLTTVCSDGTLHSRPMATQDAEFDGALWFFTCIDAPKVGEVNLECQVNVSYADQSEQRYVSISGRAELVLDREKIIELWNPSYKVWFHQGLDDPQLALLRVDADKAEYWDSRSNTMMQIVGFSKNPTLQH